MIVLIKRLTCLLGAFFITCLIIWVGAGRHDEAYMAATLDKQKLLTTAPSPKVVLVGGSNLAFGVDSGMIEARIGLPVVNMGLHADIGLAYMLEEVKPYVRSDDTIVVIPEYEQFYGETMYGGRQLWMVLWAFPEGFNFLKWPSQYLTLATSFHQHMAVRYRLLGLRLSTIMHGWFPGSTTSPRVSVGDSDYFRSGFDHRGDYIAHLGLPAKSKLQGPEHITGALNESAFRVLADFGQFVTAKGAKLIVLWPSLAENHFQARKDKIDAVVKGLGSLGDIDVRGTPAESAMPTTLFFDTMYHLNAQGRHRKTEEILTHMLRTDENSLPRLSIQPGQTSGGQAGP
jgi:hypothetical protein